MSDDATQEASIPPPRCPELGAGVLTTWDLDPLEIDPGLDVQGNRFASPVAPEGSVWFTAATTTEVANDHGLLVNLDPNTNLFRVWDLDTWLGTAVGLGANFLEQDLGAVWVSVPQGMVHRLDPLARNQLTWSLPVNPFTSVLRGIKVMPDGSLMISLQNTAGTGSIQNLNPTSDALTGFTLPEESAPFGGAVAPDGAFFFGEFDTNRIARLDPRAVADNLTEWQLPGDGHPIRLFIDRHGMIWFTDQQRVGRLDPERNTVAFFEKPDVFPQDVAPIGRMGLPTFVAVADGQEFMDVLCVEAVQETEVPVLVSTTPRVGTLVAPAPSRPILSRVELIPEVTAVVPSDPEGFTRYAVETPTFAITQHQRALYATGVRNLPEPRKFRFYRLEVCDLPRAGNPG